jgi:hypothetical protein
VAGAACLSCQHEGMPHAAREEAFRRTSSSMIRTEQASRGQKGGRGEARAELAQLSSAG